MKVSGLGKLQSVGATAELQVTANVVAEASYFSLGQRVKEKSAYKRTWLRMVASTWSVASYGKNTYVVVGIGVGVIDCAHVSAKPAATAARYVSFVILFKRATILFKGVTVGGAIKQIGVSARFINA